MLAIGWLCVAFGMIGIIIPILPTTPFLLLAAYLFSRSSKRCESYLLSTTIYKRYALPFKEQKGLTLQKKAEILILVYTVLLISGLLITHLHARIILFVIAVTKLIILIRIPTLKEGRLLHDSKGND